MSIRDSHSNTDELNKKELLDQLWTDIFEQQQKDIIKIEI